VSDDIVTQLRRDRHNHIEDWWLLEDMCNEAADEIERLRKEVNTWMGAAERFAESDPKFDAWMYYFKARRNEQG
jgi:hypothetical protein